MKKQKIGTQYQMVDIFFVNLLASEFGHCCIIPAFKDIKTMFSTRLNHSQQFLFFNVWKQGTGLGSK